MVRFPWYDQTSQNAGKRHAIGAAEVDPGQLYMSAKLSHKLSTLLSLFGIYHIVDGKPAYGG